MKIQRLLVAALLIAIVAIPLSRAFAADAEMPPRQKWSFAGPFGTFDRGQLQRGFKVYRQICQNCHGLALLSFRNLAEPGGPGFTAAQAAAIAAEYQFKDKSEDGEPKDRPGQVADRFPPPTLRLPNAVAPDLSVIVKARGYERGFPWFILDMFTQYQEHGADYIVAMLTGYEEAPKGKAAPAGTFYNRYFPGHFIAMPQPLDDKSNVEYTDGTKVTGLQLARDVTAFLAWAAEPHMEARKRIGLQVIVFLIVFAGLLYFTKKKVWRDVHHHPEKLTPRPPTEYPKT